MPNPYRKSWTARPTDEIRNDPEYIRSRATQGALLDTVGGPSDLANYLSDYFYSGLNSLLDVGGLSPYNVPQSLGTTNRRPIPGGSPQLEQGLVQSGMMRPSTGTTQETAMRMGLGLLDPTPVGSGSLTGPRGQNVFYSGLLDTAQNAPMQKGSADQWMGYLQNQPGVKQSELEWTGVEDWLKSKDRPVTRQELDDYLQGTEIQVQEVVKGASSPYPYQTEDEWQNAIFSAEREGDFDEADRLTALWEESEGFGLPGTPKFADYTYGTENTGGENYRELLLTVPKQSKFDASKVEIKRTRDSATQGYFQIFYDGEAISPVYGDSGGSGQYGFNTDEEIMEIARLNFEVGDKYNNVKGREFSSSHWDEPNVIAHVRFNDRTTPEGEDVLFLEEIQSDWAQEVRKRGYSLEEDIDAVREARKQAETDYYSALSDALYGKTNSFEEAGRLEERVDGLAREVARHPEGSEDEMIFLESRAKMTGLPIEEMAKLVAKRRIANDMTEKLLRISDQSAKGGAPKGPFIGSTEQWTSLALKRMMRYAADNGYDRIAWTPGSVQADRYDLSKHIDEVHLSGSNLVARDKNGRDVINTTGVTNETLKDYIGEELAEKLLAQPANGTLRSLYGTDLQVGGEGMKSFYDKIIPSIANKIGKKYGAKTEVTTIKTDKGDLKALSIPVSEKLKSAAKGGFPYYAIPLTVGGSGLLAEEQRRRRPASGLLSPFGRLQADQESGRPREYQPLLQ